MCVTLISVGSTQYWSICGDGVGGDDDDDVLWMVVGGERVVVLVRRDYILYSFAWCGGRFLAQCRLPTNCLRLAECCI